MNPQSAAPYDFNISDILHDSWKNVRGFKATVWGCAGFLLLIGIPLVVVFGIISYFLSENKLLSDLVTYIPNLIMLPMIVGFKVIAVKRAANYPVEASMIFDYYKDFIRIIGLYFTYFILILIPISISAFCIGMATADASMFIKIPIGIVGLLFGLLTIYLSICYWFAPVILVEKNVGILEAFRISRKGVSQHFFKIVFVSIIMLFIYVASAMLFLIGLIWTLPWLYSLVGLLYKTIFGVEKVSL
jgi:hypothetical protein